LRSYCTFVRQYYPECIPPWTAVLVELAEGVTMVSNAPDIPVEELREDMPLVLAFTECEDDHGTYLLPIFRSARTAPKTT
jgi:hypothetical protein